MTIDVLGVLRDGLTSDPSVKRPAGIEIRQDLEPAGSLPVQPPSYEGRLEIHERHLDNSTRPVIELDSVGSAANRIEEALLDLYRSGNYPLPASSTTVDPSEGGTITITTLEAPHRIYDAWIRLSESDAEEGDTTFEASPHGRELSFAHTGALDPIFETSAHDLLFGVWDSHNKGPHGQVRIARSLATTVIGLDPIEQARFAARRDPLNLGDGSDLPKGAKKLSEQGLSSIPPQILNPEYEEGGNGGVAISEARHLGFLSFASLRRLGFESYGAVEARVALAALGLYGLALRSAAGWSLRSSCALVAKDQPQYTLVGPSGSRETFDLAAEDAKALLDEATAGLKVNDRSVHLKAGKKLNDMVDKAVAAGAEAS
jgi:CRISPR-associated protein Csb1